MITLKPAIKWSLCIIYTVNTQLSKTCHQPLLAKKTWQQETVKNRITKEALLCFGYAMLNCCSTMSSKNSFSWNTEKWHSARCIGSLFRSAPIVNISLRKIEDSGYSHSNTTINTQISRNYSKLHGLSWLEWKNIKPQSFCLVATLFLPRKLHDCCWQSAHWNVVLHHPSFKAFHLLVSHSSRVESKGCKLPSTIVPKNKCLPLYTGATGLPAIPCSCIQPRCA